LKAAETAYEAALATGAYSPEDSAKTTRMLFRLSAGNQQYAKAAEYGKQVADSGAATADDLGILSQIFYLQKDCKNSGVWADKAIAAARKAGEAPKENLYQFKLQCASDAGDTPGMAATLVDLIKLTNKTNYWNTLLRIERQEERDDHNTLMLYRVMYDTASMNAGTDYIEMAQLLGDAALPAEAQTVLEKAMSSGLINDQQKERTTRLLNSFKSRAEADKKGQAQLDAEAKKNPAGELDVKLGEVYYGLGDYQNAVTAINRGLQKGQIKHLDEGYVYLGRSQVALKDTADAKKAFAGLKQVPNISPRVLKLWELYADTLGR
jgi:tetratricopeptide (TPR) repeat protein